MPGHARKPRLPAQIVDEQPLNVVQAIDQGLTVPSIDEPNGTNKTKPATPTSYTRMLPVRRQGQRPTDDERKIIQDVFLEELVKTANVRASCALVGISHTTVYDWVHDDPDFQARFEKANSAGNYVLVSEAVHRAMVGDEEVVVSMGKIVYKPDGTPQTIMRKSDRLLELLLRAKVPEFRDRSLIVNILPKEYIALPEDGTEE